MGVIHKIACLVLIWNVLLVIGYFFIGKFLHNTDLLWLFAILDPNKTSESIKDTAGNIGRSILWIIGAIVVLSLF